MMYPADQLDAVLRQSDIVLVALPGTAGTRHVIGAQQLRAMKPDAILVNVGRGSAIDEAALIDAINQHGRGPEEDGVGIRAAALDVFEHEPLAADSPLWSMPNVLITPHVAGNSADMWPRAVHLFCDNLARFTRGQPLLNVVDRELGY
jgi:phosphoglycerate dehydrogenase-like enzyme